LIYNPGMTQENKKAVKVEDLKGISTEKPKLLPITRNYTDEVPEGVVRVVLEDSDWPKLAPSLKSVVRDYTDEMESTTETRKNTSKVKIRDFTKDLEGVNEEKFNVVKASKKRKVKIKIRDYSDEDRHKSTKK